MFSLLVNKIVQLFEVFWLPTMSHVLTVASQTERCTLTGTMDFVLMLTEVSIPVLSFSKLCGLKQLLHPLPTSALDHFKHEC